MAREVVLEQARDNWVARGLRITHEGEEAIISTSREYILSCGCVQSPGLLELLGIGNPSVLQKAGIAVKVDNPNVGENLQEHMSESDKPSEPPFLADVAELAHSDRNGLRDRSLSCYSR